MKISRWFVLCHLFSMHCAIAQVCDDASIDGADADDSLLPFETLLPIANPGSNLNQQTFIRFINPTDSEANDEVYGIDDGGKRSRQGALSFTLPENSTQQFTAQDIEDGNPDRGLTSNLCDGQGKWQLRVRSDVEIRVMGFIRTADGFLTSLNEVVPRTAEDNFVYFANPASNTSQQTFLRIVNLTGNSNSDTVTISGIDDDGTASTGTVTFPLGAHESIQMTSQDLELGSSDQGLTGNLGDGTGKWRLTITSSLQLQVMSLIRTPNGFLTNLSSVVDQNTSGAYTIYFANPASETFRTTFLRIINTSTDSGTVTIAAVDDDGNAASGGNVEFTLAAGAAKQMTSADLETGNNDKGLSGNLGAGSGRWRLNVTADVTLKVMSLVRTPDGFLTNLSSAAPSTPVGTHIYVFNPASNAEQQSSLRLVNNSSNDGTVTIAATDDNGNLGGEVTFSMIANSGETLTASDLETGREDITGSLGDGDGKWRMTITSDVDLTVQSLLQTPEGFLTNLSSPVDRHISAVQFPDEALAGCVAQTGVTYVRELTHLSCFLQGVTDSTGIDQLTSLVELDLSGNEITTLDISRHANLEVLNLSNNQLSTIDVSGSPQLQQLDITDNSDVSCVDIEVIERDHDSLDEVVHNEDCGSNWELGIFTPTATFTDMCAAPREGINPASNLPYPDIQGRRLDENNWLRSMSNDLYLWYDEIEDLDPGDFETPQYFELQRTLATTPSGSLKDKFHFSFDTEVWRLFSQSGSVSNASYGAVFAFLNGGFPPRHIVVSYTQPDSPAAQAGLSRGARLMEIDGVDVVFGNDINTLNAGLFPAEIGEAHDFVVQDLDSETTRNITMTAAEITSVPVQHVQTIDTETGQVGYLFFNAHVRTAEQQLMEAIESLRDDEVTDLVIDFRYNGGGFLAIASQLAYMVAGEQTDERTFEINQWNDKHPNVDPVTNQVLAPTPFYATTVGLSVSSGAPLPTLDLSRVFVLTGPGTCSASEAFMNSLRGIDVEVIQVGSTTCGKPYGFYAMENCSTSYFTVQFRGVNEKNFGDYTDGFSPSNTNPVEGTPVPGCAVPDDFTHAFGDPNEARLAAALTYRETGACPSSTSSAARQLRVGVDPAAVDGVIIAHPMTRIRLPLPDELTGNLPDLQ